MESSPCPVFLLAVIDEGAVPAVGAANCGDDLLIFGRDEALAVAHLEVLGAAEGVGEFLADAMLHVARHIVVEVGHAPLLHDTGVWAELRTLLASDLRVAGIDGLLGKGHRVGILSDEPAQALFLERTTLDETH